MTVNNSQAVISALLGKKGEFKRTPKFFVNGRANRWSRSQYNALVGGDILWEVAFGIYTILAALLARAIAPPFVLYFLLYAVGFFSIAIWGIADRWAVQRPVPTPSAEAEPIGQPGR